MAGINKVVADRRFAVFRGKARITDAEALGCLLLLWSASRDAKKSQATREHILNWLPLTGQDEEQVLKALGAAGYLLEASDAQLSIVDNVAAQAEYERRAAIGAIGGKASAAKRAKKVRKKRVAKVAVEHSKAMVSGVETTLSLGAQAWNAYAAAYEQRWRTPPVSNATVRGQMAAIVKRIGARALAVMPFYVEHNDSFYVLKQHPVGIALKDCESLATQCATQRPVTSRDVRDAEKEYSQYKQLEDIRAGRI